MTAFSSFVACWGRSARDRPATQAAEAAEATEAALWCLQQRPAALPALPGSTRQHDGRGSLAGAGRADERGGVYSTSGATLLPSW